MLHTLGTAPIISLSPEKRFGKLVITLFNTNTESGVMWPNCSWSIDDEAAILTGSAAATSIASSCCYSSGAGGAGNLKPSRLSNLQSRNSTLAPTILYTISADSNQQLAGNHLGWMTGLHNSPDMDKVPSESSPSVG